jgi:hypothetical protein
VSRKPAQAKSWVLEGRSLSLGVAAADLPQLASQLASTLGELGPRIGSIEIVLEVGEVGTYRLKKAVKLVAPGYLDAAFVATDADGAGVLESHAAGDFDLSEARAFAQGAHGGSDSLRDRV